MNDFPISSFEKITFTFSSPTACNLCGFTLCFMFQWVFHSQKKMDFEAQGGEVWLIVSNDRLLDEHIEEFFF